MVLWLAAIVRCVLAFGGLVLRHVRRGAKAAARGLARLERGARRTGQAILDGMTFDFLNGRGLWPRRARALVPVPKCDRGRPPAAGRRSSRSLPSRFRSS